eukprot:2180641-Pleurochrysis_carterae.AAC.2
MCIRDRCLRFFLAAASTVVASPCCMSHADMGVLVPARQGKGARASESQPKREGEGREDRGSALKRTRARERRRWRDGKKRGATRSRHALDDSQYLESLRFHDAHYAVSLDPRSLPSISQQPSVCVASHASSDERT